MSTRKELLEIAKEHGIKGRWDMNKAQLEAAINAAETATIAEITAETDTSDAAISTNKGRKQKFWHLIPLCPADDNPEEIAQAKQWAEEYLRMLTPQGQVVAKAAYKCHFLHKDGFTMADVAAQSVELGLKTKQDPIRIVRYYWPVVATLGFEEK